MSLPSHSGLYRIVREEYGVQALKSVRYYVNSASKESRLRQHIAFNHRCRRYGLTPRSLAVKPLVSTQEGHRVAARASRQFLSARVQQCYGKLRRLETDIFFQKHQLEFIVGKQRLSTIEEHKGQVQEKVARAAKESQKKKFDALVSKQSSQQKPDERHVVNLSSKQLTTPQLQVLSRGLNFAPTPKFIPKAHIVASVEAAITQSNVTEGEAIKARIGVINALSHAKLSPTNIHPQEAKAVKELAKDDDIVILPADKGRATVVMERSDYSAKMLAMLGDRDTYQLMAKDPTTSLENRILLKRRREGRLSGKTHYHLRSSAAGVPRLYGLPKVHKPDVPLCPIVSFVSSPTYALSKFLASLLSPIVGLSDSHARNS